MKQTFSYTKWVPSPFAIAILLTVLVAFFSMGLTNASIGEVITHWNRGIWELLAFAMQMILMLILGHALALSKLFDRALDLLLRPVKTGGQAAVLVSIVAILTGSFNWGLGLIIGALLAKKVHHHASINKIPIQFALIATCGYLSLMVWHAGISGTAPVTVASPGHSLESTIGIVSESKTLFSKFNISAFFGLLVILPFTAYGLNKRGTAAIPKTVINDDKEQTEEIVYGAEKLDHSKWAGLASGFLMIVLGFVNWRTNGGGLITLNNINLLLFGLALMAHGSFVHFTRAIQKAMGSSAGIAIQFPLYAGIMGIMKYSGLAATMASGLVESSTTTTFPLLALVSSGIINILVPSGGGQWQIQGPILVEAAQMLNYPINKTVMALAYGDQLTNMLQPFWALPLLGITGLKIKDILPYCLVFMMVGFVVYTAALLFL